MIGRSKELTLPPAEIGRQRYEVNKEFVARAANVLRSLKGHRGLAIELMWEFPELLGFLEEQLSSNRIHYFHASVELANAQRMSKSELFQFVQAVIYERRRDAIRRFSAHEYPDSAIRLLYRLRSPMPLRAREYYILLEASKNRSGSKALNHQSEVYFSPIYYWNSLPSQLQSTRLLSILLQEPGSLRKVSTSIDGLLPAPTEESLRRFGQSLSSTNTSQQLISRCRAWRNKFNVLDNFPSPPLPASEGLNPISSGRALRTEGQVMRLQHLAHPIPEIFQGTAYYYHWDGDVGATIELKRRENDIWYLNEGYRKGGAPISREDEKFISALILEQQAELVSASP